MKKNKERLIEEEKRDLERIHRMREKRAKDIKKAKELGSNYTPVGIIASDEQYLKTKRKLEKEYKMRKRIKAIINKVFKYI